MNISRGKIERAQKVVIYGPEGIGKTTLASQFPDPLFIDTEGGTAHLDVARVEDIYDWENLVDSIAQIAKEDLCKTLVIDTADWAEQMCITHVCTKNKQKSIEAFGYGKGYVYLQETFQELLYALDVLIDSGINVVLTAHAKMRKFEQPDEIGAYDRWEMKLSKNVAPIVKEWADMVLFCNYETFVVNTDGGKAKAQGGKRVIYTQHHPCWDAKNRHGLPEKLDMDYKGISHIFHTKTKAAEPVQNEYTPIDHIKELMKRDGVIEMEICQFIASRGKHPEAKQIEDYPAEFIDGYVLKYWDRIVSGIKSK